MEKFVKPFLSFDKLIGTKIIKVLYFIGMAIIVLATVIMMLMSLASIGQNFLAAIGGFIIIPIIGIIYLLFWRFIMEMYLLMFRISDDLRDIKNDKLGVAPNDEDIA